MRKTSESCERAHHYRRRTVSEKKPKTIVTFKQNGLPKKENINKYFFTAKA